MLVVEHMCAYDRLREGPGIGGDQGSNLGS